LFHSKNICPLLFLTYEGDLTLSTGTCFIQKIYAPSSSLKIYAPSSSLKIYAPSSSLIKLSKEEEGAYIF
jgi:hypothetical protein